MNISIEEIYNEFRKIRNELSTHKNRWTREILEHFAYFLVVKKGFKAERDALLKPKDLPRGVPKKVIEGRVQVNPTFWKKEKREKFNLDDAKREGEYDYKIVKNNARAYLLKVNNRLIVTPGEYLVDLSCYNKNDEYSTELAMEVEFNPDEEDVDWDFYKLIDIKAPIKVWVSRDGEKQIELLHGILSKSKIKGEIFLLVFFQRSGDRKIPELSCFKFDGEERKLVRIS